MKTKMIVAVVGMCSLLQLTVTADDKHGSAVDAKDRQSQVNRTDVKQRQAKWHPPLRRAVKAEERSYAVVLRHVLPWEPFAPGD
jgi:hypothetical protein